MKVDYTFHSHTYRCGHAVGDIHDYVHLAIKKGYKIYGVSDHVMFPDFDEPGIRGKYSEIEDYVEEYKRVKEKYSNQIQMYLGFECEYSKYYLDYYKSFLKEKGFDYLICGQHNGFDKNRKFYGYSPFIPGSLEQYKDDFIEAMKTGIFLYYAHPDLFFIFTTEVTEEYKRLSKEIIDAAIKYDAVLEINIHGLLRERNRDGQLFIDYPCEYFWKEVAKTNIKVVYGGDFHDPREIDDDANMELFKSFVKKCGIKLSDINEIYNEYQKRLKKLL